MSPVSDLTSGQPTVERLPPKAPGGRPAPPDIEPLITEVAALAGLLAQVVEMARKAAIFPGHWETIAEHAMEHQGVRAALAAEDALMTRSDSMAAARPASPGGAVTVPAPPAHLLRVARMSADSADLTVAKRLLDAAKDHGFRFQRIAPGPDGPLRGVRETPEFVDELYLSGFWEPGACTAIRRRRCALLVPGGLPVTARIEGDALTVLHTVVTDWA